MIRFPILEAIEKFFKDVFEMGVTYTIWLFTVALLIGIGVLIERWILVGAGAFVWIAGTPVFIARGKLTWKRKDKE